jgi:hypothetical protein
MACTNLAILLINKTRIAIGLLASQYIFAFLISLPVLPIRTLFARLIGGLLVCMILFTSERRFSRGVTFIRADSLPWSIWFRLITSLIVFIVAWAFAYQSQSIPSSIGMNVFMGAVFNICLGSLMLGLYKSPLEAAIGLLTLLIGFDLFYGAIEPSLAIVVLLITIQLIISLATSYIMSIAHNTAKPEKGFS